MQHRKLLGLALIGTLVSACSGDEARAEARADVEEVEREVGEAWEALRGYAYDRRADLEQRLEEEMAEWDRGIERLGREAESLAGEAQRDLNGRLAELGRRRDELANELERLRSSGEDGWSELRDGVVDSMERMQQALTDAAASLRDDA